jgi:hypothetical protein
MITFKKGNPPNLEYKKAVKKPIPVRCIQINEPFKVETMEGLMSGKKGDWLMVGIHGEMYPIDNDIFIQTYDLIKEHSK